MGIDGSLNRGLTGTEARVRLDQYGPNTLTMEKKEPFWEEFFEELRELNTTTFLVSEMARDSVRMAHHGVEEFLADTIVHLRLHELDIGMSTSVRRYIGVVKMRGVDHDMDYFPLLVEDGNFEIVAE
mgnify:CR=1 FL=1